MFMAKPVIEELEGVTFNSSKFHAGNVIGDTVHWLFDGIASRDMVLFIQPSCGCTVTDSRVVVKSGESFQLSGSINVKKHRGQGIKRITVKEELRDNMYSKNKLDLYVEYNTI